MSETLQKKISEEYARLLQSEGVSHTEMSHFEKRFDFFRSRKQKYRGKAMFIDGMQQLFGDVIPHISRRLYEIFDKNGLGFISAAEFIRVSAVILYGSFDVVNRIAFYCYDLDGDGVLSIHDIFTHLQVGSFTAEPFCKDFAGIIKKFPVFSSKSNLSNMQGVTMDEFIKDFGKTAGFRKFFSNAMRS